MNGEPVYVPKRILSVQNGPVVPGLQLVVTIRVELDDGSVMAFALPRYLLADLAESK